jgi:hypothetical protein
MILVSGKVQGQAAQKFPEFRYRQAVPPPPISSIWDLDPNRLYPDREFPRYTSISQTTFTAIDVADYEVEIADDGTSQFRYRVQLFMVPGRFTPMAQGRLQVLEFFCTPELDTKQIVDIALREAFA